MKNIFKTSIIIGFASILFTGCEKDWLDVNKNPNKTDKTSPGSLFLGASVDWSANRMGGDGYIPIGFMNQTISTGGNDGWGYVDVYDISPYSLENTWKVFYATAGANFKEAIKVAHKNNKPNEEAQAKIAFAGLMYDCTTIFGDVPYKEAWIEEINYPKFDSQKDILDDLLRLLKEATTQIDKGDGNKIDQHDLYYKGDLDKWTALANSLRLKIAMLMVDKDPSKQQVIAEVLKTPLVVESSQDFKLPFFDVPGNKNPFYRIVEKYMNGINSEFYAPESVLSLMKPLNDPRIPYYYEKGTKATEYFGVNVDAEKASKEKYAMINMKNIGRANTADVILSSSEINLLIAEAYARGLGVGKDLEKAQQFFNKGIKQSLQEANVPSSEQDKFLDTESLNLKKATDVLDVIHTQQYINFASRPLDAWTQMRRSGPKGKEIPKLTTPILSPFPKGEIARRWQYSPDELTANKFAPRIVPQMWEPMWFDE
ncbi:MAG: SusD/RagB family nutrient-binding outer membrane lipoprotein [Ornithobacterium rhinotracheale]|nr:SusD/RagB family nutrient-binding outer membrane lipoprotein [Ornithobacterium rhinotracheale]